MYLSSIFVVLLGCICLVHSIGSGNNDNSNVSTYGTRATTDTLIADEIVSKNKRLFQTQTQTYTLTQAGTAKTISYIRITDQKRKRGATAVITSGGVGDTTVTITFTSARGGGIKSRVEIYGA